MQNGDLVCLYNVYLYPTEKFKVDKGIFLPYSLVNIFLCSKPLMLLQFMAAGLEFERSMFY